MSLPIPAANTNEDTGEVANIEAIRTAIETTLFEASDSFNPVITTIADTRCTFIPTPGLDDPIVYVNHLSTMVDGEQQLVPEAIILVPDDLPHIIVNGPDNVANKVMHDLMIALRAGEARRRIHINYDADRLVSPKGFGGLTNGSDPSNRSIDPLEASLTFYAAQGLGTIE